MAVGSECSPIKAERVASVKVSSFDSPAVTWCDYWPENARVPRIVPEIVMEKA